MIFSEGGSTDPNVNSKLAKCIEFAKANNVPKANVDKAIESAKVN